ncbi:SOS response-associated peptidase [Nakamurella sp. YIM 132087]|uniref:Abasic site processing protein n=1 Tax=Nakamurella alba TaxID=2665158 RepID=A0A7K1FFV4_9ACTN|nr:SOS response-associated peptidase [Nakamurella alba]MTD12988.1 SOS response-associated peptidase [Nakamurella alba]
MCGRYATTMDTETLFGVFDAEPDPAAEPGLYGGDPPRPRYNIAPTTENPVVRLRLVKDEPADGDAAGEHLARTIEPMKWGLVPSWAKDPKIGNRMFNARSESAATTPSFRTALRKRRCLIPASGFYEWRKLGPKPGSKSSKQRKQAYWIHPADDSVMAFAGLWEYWKPKGDGDTAGSGEAAQEAIVSYTILTCDAVGEMRTVHDRMPLILPAADWAAWLDPDADPEAVQRLLAPPDPRLVEQLEFRPIGARIGSVGNDDEDLLVEVRPGEPGTAPDPAADTSSKADDGQLMLQPE